MGRRCEHSARRHQAALKCRVVQDVTLLTTGHCPFRDTKELFKELKLNRGRSMALASQDSWCGNTIKREVLPDHHAIVFEWHDRQSSKVGANNFFAGIDMGHAEISQRKCS